MSEVTRILSALEHGDSHAAAQLLPLVYDELRRLAALRLVQEKPGLTLPATARLRKKNLPPAAQLSPALRPYHRQSHEPTGRG
jgi:hypothetical protein